MKFIIYFSELFPKSQKMTELQTAFPEVEFIPVEDSAPQDIEKAHAFVGARMPPDHFQQAKDLKIVFVNFTGPNMLPLDMLRDRHVRLSNTHGNARYVAERAVAMALSFYGKIITYHDDLKTGKWHGLYGRIGLQDTWESIHGKHCALVGTGEIGRWIAQFLKIFDCRVIGFKNRPVQGDMASFDEITLDLDEAIAKSELIFVALPITAETEKIIDAQKLAAMAGKVLINVGRGHVIDEEGLYNTLKDGILKGAAIDTWYTYPPPGPPSMVYPSTYPFHELPNVILSPHVGGFTPQATQLNSDQVVENIASYLSTGRPRFEMDLDRMY